MSDQLDVAKASADSGSAKLHYEPCFTLLYPVRDVVGLHFGGTAPMDAGGLVRNLRIGEGAANDSGPAQLFRHNRIRGAYVRLRVATEAEKWCCPPAGSHHSRVEGLSVH